MALQDVLEDIRREIDDCYFAVCFEMESGLPLGIATRDFADDTDSIASAFGQVLDIISRGQKRGRNDTIREALHGFNEMILETDKSTFFILTPSRGESVAVAVGTPIEVKLGYAKVSITRHLDALRREIKALG